MYNITNDIAGYPQAVKDFCLNTICENSLCCGCGSCAHQCPTQSITMIQDREGFLYPEVDELSCIKCGLCVKLCPILIEKHEHMPIKAFAAVNPKENVREESSSGGIFTMIAQKIICEGGVVFGARWNKDWDAEHSFTETIEGLKDFRSSKYVQSNCRDCYQRVESFLKIGRKVLFSGTPCQVAALKTYLREEYENLLSIECVCHGVPSPGLWKKYLSEISKGRSVVEINHRDKKTGWRNYSVVIRFDDGTEIIQAHDNNPWVRALINNLTLRPSCHSCPFKYYNSYADITLGDLWGDQYLIPGQNEDKGISYVIIHTKKAESLCAEIPVLKNIPIYKAAYYNSALSVPSKVNKNRTQFFNLMAIGKPFEKTVLNLTKDSLLLRIKLFARKIV